MQSSGSGSSFLSFLSVLVVFIWSSSDSVDGFQINLGPSLPKLSRSSAADVGLKASSVLKETPYYSIEKNDSGPAGGDVHRLIIHKLPGQKEDDENEDPIVIETGKIGRQASGAVTLQRGETVLYATAACDDSPKAQLDFLPLSVEHQERFSSVGQTSGGYNRRDGRPAEHEILTCRLIDRPLRPLVADGWRHETQLLSWVMSYDGKRSCDPLAIVSSSTAMFISEIPLTKAVAAAMVGYNAESDTFILNPTNEEMEKSPLKLIVAGTKEGVLMIEGAGEFVSEETMIRAVSFGHDAIKVICEAVEEFGKVVGKEKNFATIKKSPEGLQATVDKLMTERVDAAYALGGTKTTQGPVMNELRKELIETLTSSEDNEEAIEYTDNEIKAAFKNLLCRRMYEHAKTTGKRCDGRELDEIRELTMEAGFLPKTHGSALFTRGETQAIATATLGDSGMRQKIDKIDGLEEKRFYLQYTFPPSCVGETGRVGAPGRREVGHGNLAERALAPTLPSEEEFPYTIRVESLITESHGSSSMASVCGGCLALMDSGVPIKNPVAGIAMGMLLNDKEGVSDENALILSDILGTEDALGTMDFKVAGDRTGITTFQLDIKCEGLSLQTMERALEQARVGRLHILDKMDEVLPKSREILPDTVPKLARFTIEPSSIGKVIGPGGKQIRAVIEDFELSNMNVQDDGSVQISAFSQEKLVEAEAFVKKLVASSGGPSGGRGERKERPQYTGPEPVEGQVYRGKITGIHAFGVFLEFMPGAEDGSYPPLEGLCHVSELAQDRVRNCEGFVKAMDKEEFNVVYTGVNKGKRSLSRKAAMGMKRSPNGKKIYKEKQPEPVSVTSEPEVEVIAKEPLSVMSEQEVDVITKAMEDLQEP
eukprot:CAMPEP_0194133258 /NCGR_PEP_ID=MMETSP0152-20130528/3504_1 /TAXON_ID=1049557 /ORGANISM="Thalassiothrix antarctica, Strain L6-D1" /LENGTH=878 /DNA_ID=CAMNT_0038828543 /DNA_START=148 /DNA_END=2785 /DNA_ORIENTATION=+